MRKLDKSDLDNESDASYRNGESLGIKDDKNNLEKEKRKKEKEKIANIQKKSKLGDKTSKLQNVFDKQKDITPLEHYNNLKKQRQKEEAKK
jgi:hypothetical protein